MEETRQMELRHDDPLPNSFYYGVRRTEKTEVTNVR